MPIWQSSFFKPCYGILVTAKCMDVAAAAECVKINEEHSAVQLPAEPGSLRYTTLGMRSASTRKYPPKEADDLSCVWLEQWGTPDDYAAHKTTPHLEAAGPRFAACVKDPATDLTIKEAKMLHMEKPGVGNGTGLYSVLFVARGKNAEDTGGIVEGLKKQALVDLSQEHGALRFTILLPDEAGDEPHVVRWVVQWADAAAHEAHKEAPHNTTPELQALVALFDTAYEEGGAFEYPSSQHLEKELTNPGLYVR